MNYRFNYSEEVVFNLSKKDIDLLKENNNLLKENNNLLKSLLGKKQISTTKNKTYDLKHKKNAAKYLLCTKEKLNEAIEKEVLMDEEHYVTNRMRKWYFSSVDIKPWIGKL